MSSSYWNQYGLNGDFKFLYVGRISKEKDVPLLAEVGVGPNWDQAH